MSNKLRIIGGQWRSRQIVFDDAQGLRPTPSRVRETLFNWLQADVINSRCLDLFAGSGALGFEAASRGAKRVLQVENNPRSCQQLKANAAQLAASQIELMQMDVLNFLARCNEQFDLVFLDPPFGQNLIGPTCLALHSNGILAPYAKIYIESERGLTLEALLPDWALLKQKTAGDVCFSLLQPPLSF